MGVKKIVMLAILVSFVAGCAPLHPSNCHKTTALGSCSSGRWDDQDEWGSKHGESGMQLMLNLMIRKNGKGKMQVAYGILPGWHGVKNINQ